MTEPVKKLSNTRHTDTTNADKMNFG